MKNQTKYLIIILSILLFVNIAQAVTWTSTNGCWTATDGAYTIKKWNATGSNTWPLPAGVTSGEVLVLGGGGGGGGGNPGTWNAAGGGAGGVQWGCLTSLSGTLTVVVGDGGAGGPTFGKGTNGQNSAFGSYIGIGGGGGSGSGNGLTGGSGGGCINAAGGSSNQTSTSPLTGYGSAGYSGASIGGGGGATQVGQLGCPSSSATGLTKSITGESIEYAKGGIACSAAAGTNEIGMGGGGTDGGGYKGGSGVVIFRYLTPTSPTNAWTQNASSGSTPFPVAFVDQTGNSPTSWNWSFGDGSFSNSQSPTHTYTVAGIFNVTLNATNAFLSNITTYVKCVNTEIPPRSNPSFRKLYLPMNGTDGSATVTDESGSNNTVYNFGQGRITTSQSKFGGSSLSFIGAGNSHLLIPMNSSLKLAGNNFYLGWWENDTSRSAGTTFMTQRRLDGNNILINHSYFFGYSTINSEMDAYLANSTPWDIANNFYMGQVVCKTWSYRVILRNGSTFESWKDGIQVNVGSSSSVINSPNNPIYIGGYQGDTLGSVSGFDGMIDDVVLYVGTALNGSVVPTRELLSNPTADFIMSNTTGQFPLVVKFTDISQGNTPTFWNWSFGDGSFSSLQNPVHTYNDVGNYSVILNVSNTFGFDNTSSKYINVSQKLIPNFSANTTMGTSPFTVQFTDASINATNWSWFFGDEPFTQPWITQSTSPGWLDRSYIKSVALPNGNIILGGGYINSLAVASNDTWISKDKGVTWTLINSSCQFGKRYAYEMVTLPNNKIILMGGYDTAVGFSSDVWSSSDGDVWTKINSSAFPGRYAFSSTVTQDGTIVIAGGYNGVFLNDTWKSTDGGYTWIQTNPSSGWEIRAFLTMSSIGNDIILTSGSNTSGSPSKFYGDVWRSSNYGATWTRLPDTLGSRQSGNLLTTPDNTLVLIGGVNETHWQSTWISKDKGNNWTLANSTPIYRQLNGAVVLNDGSIIATGGLFAAGLNDTVRLNPIGSSTQNPIHTYTTGGFYNVSLRIFDAFSYNTSIKINYTQVVTGTTANFTMNTTTASIYPLVVQFNDTSSGAAPSTWNWSFGDGRWFNTTNPLLKNVTYQYTVAQKYVVNLTVNGTLNTNTLSVPDAINLTADDDNNVTSWLHLNGTEGSTVFTGEKGVAWTNGGSTAAITNHTFKYGNGSLNLTGTRPFISAAPVPSFNFSGNDFTIEFWTNVSSTGTSNPLVTKTNTGFTNGWGFYQVSGATSSNWVFFMGSIANSSTPAISLPLNTWNHVSIERRSGTVFIYVNGMLNATLSGVSGSFDTLNSPVIGYLGPGNSNNFNGFVDEFRISNGRARWWSNFTTPYNQYNGVVETQFPDINPNSTMRYKTDPSPGATISNVTPRNRTIQIQCITYTNYVVGTSFFDNDHIFVKSVSLNTSFFPTGMTLVSSTIDNTLGEITFNISRAAGFNPGTSRASILDYQAIYWNYQDPNETNGAIFDPEDPAFNEQFLGSGYLINGTTNRFYPVHNFIPTMVTYLPWNITSNFTLNNRTSIPSLPIAFSDDSYLYGSYPNQWNWSWGNGNWTNGTANNTVHNYTVSGIYNVTSYAGLLQNQSIFNATSKNVTIYDQTTANITSNVTSGLVPTSIFFDGTGSLNATLWNWSFGDGTFNNGTNSTIVHTYTFDGIFSVNLTTSSFEFGLGSNTQSGYIVTIVDPVLTSDFTANSTVGNQTMLVIFNVTTPIDNATSWNWSFGDGTFQSGTSLEQITNGGFETGDFTGWTKSAGFSAQLRSDLGTHSGNYALQLVPNNAFVSQNINLTNVPNIIFWDKALNFVGTNVQTLVDGTLIDTHTVPSTTSFTQETININSYAFTGNHTVTIFIGVEPRAILIDDISAPSINAIQNATHYYSTGGNYSVSLNASNVASFSITTKPNYITVYNTTIASFTQNLFEFEVPLPRTVLFNDTSINATWWNWSFFDGTWYNTTDPTAKNTSKLINTDGNFTINLTTSDHGFGASTAHTYVNTTPIEFPITSISVDPPFGLAPAIITFNDTTVQNTTQWNWSFGDGTWFNTTTVSLKNTTHAYSNKGTYPIYLIASNTAGTNQSDIYNLIIYGPPVTGFTANVTNGFIPLHVRFNVTIADDNATSWDWDFGDGSPHGTTQNVTHIYLTNGTFTVVEVAMNAHPLGSNTTTLTNYIMTNFTPIFADFAINPTSGINPITISFTDASTILSHADASNGAPNTWLWLFGDGGSSTLQNPTHTYTTNGLFSPSLFVGSTVTGNFDNKVCINCVNIKGAVVPTYNTTLPGPNNSIDIVNSSGLQEWMYYMIVTNKTGTWEFPIIGFATGVMDPFTSAFDTLGPHYGEYVYLILWGLFLMMVWRQSGKVTIPALIACITAGAWGLLFPESAQPWIMILMVAAIASQLFTFFTKE